VCDPAADGDAILGRDKNSVGSLRCRTFASRNRVIGRQVAVQTGKVRF
jgi:hypothetical protein